LAPTARASWRLTMPRLPHSEQPPTSTPTKQNVRCGPSCRPWDTRHDRRAPAPLRRGTSLAQVSSSDASDASAMPHKMDDMNTGGPIFHGRLRLRALWGVFPVVVRVHSGAFFGEGSRLTRTRFGKMMRHSRAQPGRLVRRLERERISCACFAPDARACLALATSVGSRPTGASARVQCGCSLSFASSRDEHAGYLPV
jgi:hypothetical protein